MFDGCIRDNAGWAPRATAVLLPNRRVSYAELDADVDRVAALLDRLGLSPASGVVSVAIDHPYDQYVFTAALSRRAIASSPATDLAADVRLTDRPGAVGAERARVLFVDRDRLASARAAPRRRAQTPRYDPEALGRVMLSSGTTGVPHRVGLSWSRLDLGNHATLHQYCRGKLGIWIPLVGVDSMMGLALVMGAWSVGAAVANALPMAEIPDHMQAAGEGVLSLTPSKLRELLAVLPPGFQPVPGWRIVCGGSLLPPGVAREARLRLTPDIRLLYGATEVGTMALGHAAGLEDDPGQIGITPSDAVVEIVDEAGRPLPPGESGAIRARGPRLAAGYLGDPQATAERFRDGWFLTGDIGRRLPDGRLVLEGRADDRMNLGGQKVMPAPLEAAALECPGVIDAAAFAAPDADGFDRCWLAVAAAPDFPRERLAPHLARYPGLPEHGYAWIGEIPRNAMGKPERGKLRAALIAALSAS